MRPIEIYIPTFKRVDRQRTWELLPPQLRKKTKLLVHPSEAKHHKEAGRPVLSCPVQGDMTATRNWIVQRAKGPILLIDDDLKFYTRKRLSSWHLRNSTNNEIISLFDELEFWLRCGYLHVGVTARQNYNGIEQRELPRIYCQRQIRVYGYLAPALRALNVKFRTKNMSDFDMTLQLLKLGYPNLLLTLFAMGDESSYKQGGSSAIRTVETLEESARELAYYHPGLVQVVRKQADWGHIRERTDVNIRWKAAFRSAKQRHGNLYDPRYIELCQRLRMPSYPTSLLQGTPQLHLQQNGSVQHREANIVSWTKGSASKECDYVWSHSAELRCR